MPVWEPQQPYTNIEELYRVWQQKQYAPASFLVDENYHIFALFNGAGNYLNEQDGRPSLNILQKIHSDLRLDLRTALYQAFKHRKRTISRLLKSNVEGQEHMLRLHVGPVAEPGFPQQYVEVVLEKIDPVVVSPSVLDAVNQEEHLPLLTQVEEELLHVRERLQAAVEDHETANEELKASNEELQSMNGELRSITEELETSKEELQAANEQLVALNGELKTKLDELRLANSDLQNLIESTDIATIFLDRQLNVKRYTPRTVDIFNIIASDTGRPFAHISHRLAYEGLATDAAQVLRRLLPIEHELQSNDGRWFMARLIPYRTVEDRIEGVVLTLVDVTALKEAERGLARRTQQQTVVAELGQLALENADLDLLRQEATRRVAETLGVALCKVLELQPDGAELLLKAGVGWKDGYVGQATVGIEQESQAGYTLHTNGPVVVRDLRTEKRFHGPELLFEHGVVSGLSVVIRGTERAYGVFGAHGTREQVFSVDDINFFQSVANILAQAIERKQAQDALGKANRTLEERVMARTHELAVANERLQLEIEARRQAQERFYQAFEVTPVASTIASLADLRYLNVNASFLAITGYTKEEIEGRTAREISLLVDHEKREPAVTTLRNNQSVLPLETRIRTKSGEIRYVIAAGEPIDLNGEPCLLGTMIDITQRKQAEEALAKSQNLLAEAEEIADMGSWDWDLLTDTLHWSPGMRRIFQLNKNTSPAFDSDLLAHIHPEDLQRVARIFQTARSHHQPFDIEYRILHQDGSVHMVIARGKTLLDETGEPVRMIGTIQNVTERKQIENALRQSEQRLQLAIEASGVGIFEHNVPVEGESHYSDRFASIFGYTLDELPPPVQRMAWLSERIHPEDQPLLERAYVDLLEGRSEQYDVEARIRHKNGKWIWIRGLSQAASRNADGHTTKVVGVIQDVTAQKEWEEALEAHREHLQELVEDRTVELELQAQALVQEVAERKKVQEQLLALNETLEEQVSERTSQVRVLASALTLAEQRERQRIAGILHDHLQQVLYALLFRTKLFHSEEGSPQAELLAQFHGLVEDAIGMTRTLTVDLSPPILTGEGLIEAIQWLAEQMGEIHQLTVTLDVQSRPSTLQQEMRVLLFQLVRELIFNVLNHARVDQANVTIGGTEEWLTISVEDSGIGFDPEIAYDKQVSEGGWGLFSIRERLDLFGGHLEIVSTPGRGTQVTIFFPLALDRIEMRGNR